jgi:transcription elongation factor Elf1
MSEVRLQPCPRCGGGALAGVMAHAGGKVLSVHCSVCGTRTPGRATIEEAVTEWNRRLLYTMAPGFER